jgi:tetratricopeptide (TPR) repeat protein
MTDKIISNSFLAACAALAFLAAGIAAAQEPDPSGDEEADEIEFISIDDLRKSSGEDVAEDVGDEEILTPKLSENETNLEELRRNFELYKSAIATGSFGEADTLAKRMVELAIRLYGLDSHESAKALTNLGLVQQKNKDYNSAVLNFTAAVGIIERIEDRLYSDLINPLRGLGAAQLGAGRADLARDAFSRAVHISHVNEGPHNLMQIDVLEDLAETYLTVGETDEAIDVHKFIYNLESRNIDLKSEAFIPALERQAEWLHRMGIYEKERMTWRRIIHILEDTRGKGDLSLISPLTGLGNSYLFVTEIMAEHFVAPAVTSGDTYLKRALRIANENEDTTWLQLQNSMIALADYYTLTGRGKKAKRAYVDSWELLSADPERLATRKARLEQPHVLRSVRPPKYYNSSRSDNGQAAPDSFEVGTIVVGYNVSRRGETRQIGVIDANPRGLDEMEYSVKREVRRMLHRPRMADGETVETLNQSYVHEFYYRPSELPKPAGEEIEPGADGNEDGEESVAAGES